MNQPPNIIIDTDPGTDDAIALLAASVYFGSNICALVSSYGNTVGEQTYANLVMLSRLLNICAPIIKGSDVPIDKDAFVPTDYHGQNGLCDVQLPSAATPLYDGDFLVNLYSMIQQHRPVTYVAIGPLTNLARLITRFPDVTNYIDCLVIMGGGLDVFNMPHQTEYNFSADPVAVQTVLGSNIKKIFAPLDLTHKLSFSLSEIEEITGVAYPVPINTPTPHNLMAELFYKNHDTSLKHGNNGAIIHDVTPLAYMIDPRACEIKKFHISSDQHGAIFANPDGCSVNILHHMDKRFLKDLLHHSYAKLSVNKADAIEKK